MCERERNAVALALALGVGGRDFGCFVLLASQSAEQGLDSEGCAPGRCGASPCCCCVMRRVLLSSLLRGALSGACSRARVPWQAKDLVKSMLVVDVTKRLTPVCVCVCARASVCWCVCVCVV